MITQTTWKKTSVTTPHSPPPHPLGISVAIRGGGMDSFWKYTLHLRKGGKKS